MEEVRKAFDYPKFKCQVLDYNSIINMTDGFEIKRVEFDETIEIGGKLVSYTDVEHPIVYANSFRMWNSLVINKEYYQAHKEEIDRLIGIACEKANTSDISVSANTLISDALIEGISKNQNIKKVSLGTKDSVYLLKEKDYENLKNGTIDKVDTYGVSEELENNFDSIIKFNQKKLMVGNSSYESLVNETLMFYITTTLSEKELENLKYLNEEAEVEIMFDDCKQVTEVIKRFEELCQNRNFVIHISDKNEFNTYLFSHINEFSNLSNVTISVLGADYNLATYLKYEKRLIDMVFPAMNYSPFEKYMYAYNIVKQFKEYRENTENKNSSRMLYDVLDSDYMVCAGYATLLEDLLDKLGIASNGLSVKLESGLEDVPIDATVLPDYYDEEKKEEVILGQSGHARCKVHLVDPKYGIDGYYITDPTWDNDMEDDLYNFCLMTCDEYLGINRESFVDIRNHNELFFVHSLEEFYQKLNFLLDKNSDKTVNNFIELFMKDFKKIDPVFYAELIDKYPVLKNKRIKETSKEMIQDILLDIGEHVVNKTNNVVSGRTIMEGVRFLYDNAYGMSQEDAEIKFRETLEINKERQKEAFPTRYMIDKNGIEMVVLNGVNKFDLEEEPEFKL